MTLSESNTDSYSIGEGLKEESQVGAIETYTAAEFKRPVNKPAIEAAVRTILEAVGENVERDGLLDTPARVARMYEELFSGLRLDPSRHLETTFPEDYDEIVLVRDIPFTSMCEHHLLPFTGVAHVGYLPNGRVVGLSKLARVVEEVARRPQVQERMTQTVADMLEKRLGTKGAAVVIESEHSCMALRGVRKSGTLTVTSSLRGIFRTSPASRAEILSLINKR
ncbi:MAG: GTP cyclohydrolase I FolE [Planctomycetaceae bacterium]|nr:GTP cyclohydrolase I FolE [Planctomycetaceae bacterium]